MDREDGIAIIGVGCRFPGSDDVDEYWKTLINGENHITDIPADRWNINAFYSPEGGDGKYYCNKAGLISSGSAWDNKFFGINDIEAASVDPQHRLTLECVHMALEDAGITKEQLSGTRTGVFIGLMNHGFEIANSGKSPSTISNNTVTGYATSICSNRISYIYNLTGPSVTLDTACSASIVALHCACQAMKNGDCDMAIVGGVNRILAPQSLIGLAQAGMMSRTGQCHAFSSKADGYTRSEGCGVVLLKSTKTANEDKNKIWGTIIGSAVNHNGRSVTPITKPSSQQQKSLVQKLLKECKVDPNEVNYIEAHGTGTQVGDAAETRTIIETYGTTRDPHNGPCYVGSSKSNLGHTESASGMAGIIKVLLMINHGQIVPSLHYEKNPNKNLKFVENNLCVATEVGEWPVNKHGKRVAALNSFGFGGTNTHVLVESVSNTSISEDNVQLTNHLVIAFSAKNPESLKNTMQYYLRKMKVSRYSLEDLSYTSTVKRNHYPYRAAFPVTSLEEVEFNLENHLLREHLPNLSSEHTQIIFVFCGMGTTWEGMARELMKNHQPFYNKIRAVNDIFMRLSGNSLLENITQLTKSSPPSVVQPALFAYQVAICELFKAFGVTPHCIVGHSVGEVAAAHVAGALDLEDAVKVIYHRGRLQDAVAGGKMLVVGKLAVDQVEKMCKPFRGKLCIAAYNSPTSCTISGDADAVDELFEQITYLDKSSAMNLFLRILPVSSAFHSHHIDPIVPRLISALGDLRSSKTISSSTLFSTVAGREIDSDKLCNSQYWAENMRKPVLFDAALRNALSDTKTNIVIEVGPKPALRANVAEICSQSVTFKHMPSANVNSEIHTIMSSICELYQIGLPIRWETLFESKVLQNTNIPRYQFLRLLQPVETEINESLEGLNSDSHPFIRILSRDPTKFEVTLDANELTFVRDHVVFNELIAPGSAQAEVALHCATTIQKSRATLRNCEVYIELLSPLKTDEKAKFTVSAAAKASDVYELTCTKDKTTISICSVRLGTGPKKTGPLNIDLIKRRLTKVVSAVDFYEVFQSFGFQYGPSLKGVQKCWGSYDEVLTSIKVPPKVLEEVPVLCVHPAVLDMLFQASIFFVYPGDGNSSGDINALPQYLPKTFSGLAVLGAIEDHMYGYLQLIDKTDSHLECWAALLDGSGRVIVECQRLTLKNTFNVLPECLFYDIVWEKQDNDLAVPNASHQDGNIVVFAKADPLCEVLCNSLGSDVDIVNVNSKIGALFSQKETIPLHIKAEMASFLRKFSTLVYCWAFGHSEGSLQINELDSNAKFICNGLRNIYAIIQAFNLKLCVIAVTFNTQFCGYETRMNIVGSELWGMVRCLQNEINTSVNPSILIDMGACSSHELTHLSKIVHNPMTLECPEIALRESEVLFNSIRRVDKEIKQSRFRTNHVKDHSRPLRIIGGEHCERSQYVLTKQLTGNDDKNVSVSVSSFGHPDPYMLPLVLTVHGEQPLNTHVVNYCAAVDMAGFVIGKNNKRFKEGTEVVVCYPTILQSVLNVPEGCVIPIQSVPKHCRPLLSMFVILWDILNCKVSLCAEDNVLVLYGSNKSKLAVLLHHVIQYYSKNVTSSIVTMDHTFDGYDVIFLLTDVSEVPSIPKHALKKLMVVQEQFPQSGLNNHWMNPNYLKLALPKTVEWLKKLKKKGFLPNPDVTDTKYQGNFQKHSSSNSKSIAQHRPKSEELYPVLCDRSTLFDQAATYLVIGGHTGLGKELVKFLASRHAGLILILSRREPSKDELNFMKRTSELFCSNISCATADIADYTSLSSAMSKFRRSYPSYPIKGVFSGAMVLSDAIVENQSYESFCKVLNPKILGTLNLHLATQNDPLDYFVMHSSLASAIGNQGQTNYGAANSFMDSFAFYRRKRGKPSQTINWGPLALGALEGRDDLIRSFSLKGMEPLRTNEIHHCLESILVANLPQVIVWNANWTKILKNGMLTKPKSSSRYRCRTFIDPILYKLQEVGSSGSEKPEFNEEDKYLPPSERLKKLTEFLQYTVSEILVTRVNSILVEDSLPSLGIDSNLAVEVRMVVSQKTGCNLSMISLLSDAASVKSIADDINEFLSSPEESTRL